MTIRDQEVLDALRDEPELLAIADAVAETQRSPRPAHRRVAWRAGAVLAVGAAVVLAVLFWPTGSGRNGVLDRALAAIGDGPVLHLVVRTPTGEQLVDLRSGRTTVPTYELESWSDRDLKRLHLIVRRNGRIVGEVLLPQDGGSVRLTNVDPAYTALWTGYRQALADGTAKIEREGTLYGHSVYWLTFPPAGGAPEPTEVAIDRQTYEPLDFRLRGGSTQLDQRVLLARTEPFRPSAFERQTALPSLLAGSGHASGGGQVSPVQPSTPVKPWLEAGPAIAGAKLSSITPQQTTTDNRTSNGFQLVYGPEQNMQRSVIVDEARRPDDPSEWKGVPSGAMRVMFGEASDGQNSSYTLWTGNLVVHGVYVSIQTGLGREALLEAARALRPA